MLLGFINMYCNGHIKISTQIQISCNQMFQMHLVIINRTTIITIYVNNKCVIENKIPVYSKLTHCQYSKTRAAVKITFMKIE